MNLRTSYTSYLAPTGVLQEADFEVSAAREMRREQKNIKAKRKESGMSFDVTPSPPFFFSRS